MRHDVAGAVDELPLVEGVVDDLVAGLDAPLDEVGLLGAGEGTTGAAGEHRGLQVVAGVVQEIPDALQSQGLTKGIGARIALELAQEVAAEDVKGLLLVGAEGRGDEADAGSGGDPIGSQGAEACAVLGDLLAVEVDREAERLVDGADVGLPGLRDEAVPVLGRCGERLDFPRPVAVGVIGDVALQVGVDRPVLAALVEAAEHVAIVPVTEA